MLDKDIRGMLDNEYKETLNAISASHTGGDDAKWQLQKLAELHRQRMAEEQSERESYIQIKELDMKQKQNEQEIDLKKEQLKDGKFDRVVKVVLDGVAIVVPCAVSSYWMGKGLKFEETGSFTSRVGNWISGHMRIFKK